LVVIQLKSIMKQYGDDLKIKKLNESYSEISGNFEELRQIYEYLKIKRPGAFFDPQVKAGIKSEFEYFAVVNDHKLYVLNGHVDLLKQFNLELPIIEPDYTAQDIDNFLIDVQKELPFEPFGFQKKAFKESILNYKQINKMCTGSGKSLTISLIAEFFRKRNKKGLLLVPNINLLTQFKNDIEEYNLKGLHDEIHVIGGGETLRHFDKALTISTWQSLQERDSVNLDNVDYVICDETHRFASEVTSSIVKETINCKYKFGFTGTVPDDVVQKMTLIGLFGLPKTYVTSKELIERGLATPIKINSIIFNYNKEDKKLFREIKASGRSSNKYPAQLAFIKEHEQRNKVIVNLVTKLKGNSLVLFQHTEHGKLLFIDIMHKLYPDVEVQNKNITGKKSFEFQEQYSVFFINGEDDSKIREKTRKILETHDNAILVSNYQILSTGVNIKKLHNMIFTSPIKSYTTITQSIGRLMRLHHSKIMANVYDLVDNFGLRGLSGIFYKQYLHRQATSYNPEEYPIVERIFEL